MAKITVKISQSPNSQSRFVNSVLDWKTGLTSSVTCAATGPNYRFKGKLKHFYWEKKDFGACKDSLIPAEFERRCGSCQKGTQKALLGKKERLAVELFEILSEGGDILLGMLRYLQQQHC